MINQYYKQKQDFDGLVQKLGQEILDISSNLELGDQITDEEAKLKSNDYSNEDNEQTYKHQSKADAAKAK